jgi:hypothetical protein
MTGGSAERNKRRSEAAVALRIAGATYDDIAATLGYRSSSAAAVQVERALAKTVSPVNREQMRDLAGRRLERMIRSAWPKAVNPDSPEQLPAIRMVKDLIDRHSRLYGLDAPAEIVVHTPTTAEIEQWVASVLTSAVPDVIEADVVEVLEADVVPDAPAENMVREALAELEGSSPAAQDDDQEDHEEDPVTDQPPEETPYAIDF